MACVLRIHDETGLRLPLGEAPFRAGHRAWSRRHDRDLAAFAGLEVADFSLLPEAEREQIISLYRDAKGEHPDDGG